MQDQILLTPMHLSDAPRLRQAGIELDGKGSIAALRESMRHLLDLCGRQAWTASSADGAVLAVAGFQVIDPVCGRAVLHLRIPVGRLGAETLQAFIHKAFKDLDLYRLELVIPVELAAGSEPVEAETPEMPDFQELLVSTGWRREGRLHHAAYDPQTQRHHDVVLYSMIRPDSRSLSMAFVPFNKGIFVISGDQNCLQGTDLVRYGSRFRHYAHREAAEQMNLLDADGKLLKRHEIMALMNGRPYLVQDGAPEMLADAASQVLEYFAGRRTTFDLPLNLEQGSAFQIKVWRELGQIPYGITWTYEELASHLEDAGPEGARKMSRAVGSACGANPFPLLLPCHRVIGKDGKLVGFSSGLDIKEYLLAHEVMGFNE